MKKITLLLIALLISVVALSQDSRLYGNWDVYSFDIKFGGTFYISSVDPPISPWVTISETLDYNGFGVCNTFSGNFEFNPETGKIIPMNFEWDELDCEDNLLNGIETEFFGYFGYFSGPFGNYQDFYIDDDDKLHLRMYTGSPGFAIDLVERTLSTEDFSKNEFKIFPNPVSNELFISAENLQINQIKIYSVIGQVVFETAKNEKSINVSNLKNGIYFVEITSDKGKTVQKFIKE